MPMKALVTGSAGFVGRHFVAELQVRGWDVSGVDLRRTRGFRAWNGDALRVFSGEYYPSERFDLVVHAAACEPHRSAIDGKPATFPANVHLDAAMFEWAIRTEQGRVLYLSSSAAYPKSLQCNCEPRMRLREEHINLAACAEPDAAYGWAKLTGERMAAAAREAGVPVTVVRPFSGYGEDQSENFPFRALVERARRREDPYTIWGDGRQVRDWIHIDDVIAGALAVVESGTDQPVSLCTGVGTSMVDLAGMACRQVGYTPTFEFRADKPAGVAYRVGDPIRLHEVYIPQVSLEDGVTRALRA